MYKDITWEKFELNNPNKEDSFENLCRLLFKHELCPEGTILESEHNHAGVEVCPVLSKDNKVISYQSKYFDNRVNYELIKKSARATVKKYKNSLDVWYLYTNLSLSDCSSYRELVQILSNNGTDFIVISNNEILTDVLKYSYIMAAFFDVQSIPLSNFGEWVNSSLNDLGIRYNSAFNVETDTIKKLNLFIGNKKGVEYINLRKFELLASIEKHCENLSTSDEANYDYIEKVYQLVCELDDVSMSDYPKAIDWYESVYVKLKSDKEMIDKRIFELEKENEQKHNRVALKELEWERDILDELKFSEEEIYFINSKMVIVNGEAGTGKSQLFAMEALENINDGCEAVLLLGEYFLDSSPVADQMLSKLNLNFDFDKFISLLERYGEINNRNIVIFIDAINESEIKKIWKRGIIDLHDKIKKYNRVKIAISYRSGYEGMLFSDGVDARIKSGEVSTVTHRGFEGNFIEATRAFFDYYDIRFSPIYIMQNRMQNPLFLSIFCKTYRESKKALSFPKVFANFIKHADREVKSQLNIEEEGDLVSVLLMEVVRKSIEEKKRYIDKTVILKLDFWNTYGLNNKKLDFLNAMVKVGALNVFPDRERELYDLGYDLLRDYMYARNINELYSGIDSLCEYVRNTLLTIKSGKVQNCSNKSIYISLLAMMNEEKNKKLLSILNVITDDYDKRDLVDDYIASFSWRDNSNVSDEFICEFVSNYDVSSDVFWQMLLENSLRKDSRLNARFMHKIFKPMKLNLRDSQWTIYINGLYNKYERIYQLIDLFEHDLESCKGLEDEECELSLILFGWVLTSSNRSLRDHTSKAIFNILYVCPKKMPWFVKQFAEVDDPYVVGRIYCVCFGVITKIPDKELNSDFAKTVYDMVFAREEIVPDALIREFAYLIILKCIDCVGDIDGIDVMRIKPPYNSIDIPNVEKQNYRIDDYGSGFNRIASSMMPDKIPNRDHRYGNFGRYVFESCLNSFKDVDIENSYHYAMQFIRDELGYKDEFFSDYDKRGFHLSYYPGQGVNIERIGKKYQWIALANTVARVSDNHPIEKNSYERYKQFNGLWEVYHLRDFDPTILGYHSPDNILPQFEKVEIDYSCTDDSDESAKIWARNMGEFFEACINSLLVNDKKNCEWFRLYLYETISKKKKSLRRGRYASQRGDLYSWFLGEAFFAKESDKEVLFEKIKNNNFLGTWFPRENTATMIMLGEFPWSPSCKDRNFNEWKRAYEFDENVNSKFLSEIDVMKATISLLWEGEYDATIENAYSELLPCLKIYEDLGLVEDKKNGCFFNNNGELVAINDSLFDNGQDFLIRADALREFLLSNDYCLFWTLIGEHRFCCGNGGDHQIWSEWSGYATFDGKKISSEFYDMTRDDYLL